ncbi:MAG: large subunit ribosomal protein [Thermoproteota archaeon]|nr:large subunit ribosomal protein [Thermoproteota archaeon]
MPIDKKAITKAIEETKKDSKKRKFKQSIDLVLNLMDLDMKKPESRINELVELPNPPKKDVKVIVFASGDLALRARNAGADGVLGKEDLDRLVNDKKAAKKLAKETDFFISEAALMPLVGRVLGPALGPRGKMPTPTPPTTVIGDVIARHRKITRVRVRDQLNSQCSVGTEDMSGDLIAENVQTVISRLENKLPKGLKNIKRAYIKTTMGPLIKIEL